MSEPVPDPASIWADDLALLIEAARGAGAILQRFYGAAYEVRSKGLAGPVTDADHAANDFLMETLLGARPDYGWLSEETPPDKARLERRRTFIVDPLDGTQRFIDRDPLFCTAIALVEDGAPVAAAICMPIPGALYAGVVGVGAHKNGNPISVADGLSLKTARGLGHIRDYAGFKDAPLSVHRGGPLNVCGVLVAEGTHDCFLGRGPKHEWDVAPAAALVLAAGGQASDESGAPLRFNTPKTTTPGAVFANAALHELLIAGLRGTDAR